MSDEAEEDALSQEVEEEGIVVKARQDGSGEDELDDGNDSSELTASENDESWITWFVNLRGHDYFCEIDEEYIQDDFNLQGLTSMVPYYDYALDLMLDVEIPSDTLSDDQQEIVESAAIILYGLIHARFILTTRGMQRMVRPLLTPTSAFIHSSSMLLASFIYLHILTASTKNHHPPPAPLYTQPSLRSLRSSKTTTSGAALASTVTARPCCLWGSPTRPATTPSTSSAPSATRSSTRARPSRAT